MFQLFYELVYSLHLLWNLDTLWTMDDALPAADTMIRLTQLGNATVVTDEVSMARPLVIGIRASFVRQISLLDTFVVMREYRRDVDAVGTWHTVIAFVARNGLQVVNIIRYFHQEGILFFIYRT